MLSLPIFDQLSKCAFAKENTKNYKKMVKKLN